MVDVLARRVLLRVLPAALAALGVLLAVAAALAATAFAPAEELVATADVEDGAPLVVTAPGVLDLAADDVVVRARAEDGGPVFLGVGRAVDVDAYLADAPRAEVTGLRSEELLRVRAGEASGDPAPDPATVDVWVAQVVGDGSAELAWESGPGRWLLVAAADGTAPAPAALTMVWERDVTSPALVPLAVLAGLCLLASLALVAVPRLVPRVRTWRAAR